MLKISSLFALIVTFSLLSGCVNAPTANVSVVDDRPTIMFTDAEKGDVVVIDGIEMGNATEFSAGVTALRIESGTHTLQIKRAGATILNKKFYLSGGVSKTFNVSGN